MNNFKRLLNESSNYEVYHTSFTSAIQEVERYVSKKGFHLDKEEMADEVGLGPAKPKPGKTNKYSLKIYKNEVVQKKKVHVQVYNRGNEVSKNFELNMYIM